MTSAITRWADNPQHNSSRLQNLARTLVRITLITISEFRKNDLSLRSSALTYTILLSLVPILAMSTAVVKGLGGGDQLRDVAYSYIDTLDQSTVPETPEENEDYTTAQTVTTASSNLTTHLRSAADKLFDYVDRTNFATLGTFGVVGIFLSVILVLSHIETAMNTIWHVQNGRSVIRKISDYLTLLILMPISVNVAFAASAFLKNPTLASKFEVIFPFIWLQALILKLVPVFFIALTLYVIYIFFPNTKVKTIPALLGATLAAILWFGVQNIYISLQVGVSNYNAIYGSFATLPLFLVWVYLGWLFILAGAQVAFACQNRTSYRLTTTPAIPAQRLSGAFDIMTAVQTAFAQYSPMTTDDLIEQLPAYDAKLIAEITETLIAAGALHISTIHQQILPAAPPEKLNQHAIVNIILGSETPDTPGGEISKQVLQSAVQEESENVPALTP